MSDQKLNCFFLKFKRDNLYSHFLIKRMVYGIVVWLPAVQMKLNSTRTFSKFL